MKLYDMPGPAQIKFKNSQGYIPVNCDFTDELELLSIRKFDVEVHYFDENGESQRSHGQIADIVARNHEDYLILTSGVEVRLDRIERIRSAYESKYQS